MERDSLGERIGLREEVISRACSLAMRAHKMVHQKPYLLLLDNSPDAIFSFAGSWNIDEWLTSRDDKDSPFGERTINLALFPSLISVVTDDAATVDGAFLLRFETLLANSSFRTEVETATSENKQLIFTGHSMGAPIATLATLWLLETNHTANQAITVTSQYRRLPPKCITFGSPLLGDRILHHATKRDNWAPHFTHFIMKHDIIPRISLAPISSIQPYLRHILHYINPNSTTLYSSDFISKSKEASAFFFTVLRSTGCSANHEACKLVGSTNPLLETVAQFVQLSPFTPFGNYVFCSGSRKLALLDNPDAILQVLFYSLQLNSDAEALMAAHQSLREHLIYESVIQESLGGIQSVAYLDQLEEIPLSDEDAGNHNVAVNIALNDLGLSTRARLYLRAAGELQSQNMRNQAKADCSNKQKIEQALNVLQKYQQECADRKIGYYDAFRIQTDLDDFNSNVKRLELAGMWDEIIEMMKRFELPDVFEGRREWIELGTRYRRIVEPLDIANYYRNSLNEITGPYMGKGRPNRYRFTQRWLEHEQKMEAQCIPESCFWAEVEELCISTSNKEPFDILKERISALERSVLHWVQKGQLERYVFLNDSTFVKWWKTLPNQHRSTSCIAHLFCL